MSKATPLDLVLGLDDADEFMRKIGYALIPERELYTPLHLRPELIRMTTVLCSLYMTVGAEGMWKFLSESEVGAYVPEAIRWCRMIKASRTTDYLMAVENIFPENRIPTDDQARDEMVEQISRRAPDPLAALDQEYASALLELPRRLRDYLTAHRWELEQQIAERVNPTPKSGDAESDEAQLTDRVALIAGLVAADPNADADRLVAANSVGSASSESTVRVGDVLELGTARGFVYLQVTHNHALESAIGPVIGVLKGFHRKRPVDYQTLVDGDTSFRTTFVVDEALHKGAITRVAWVPVPVRERAFPTFRHWMGREHRGRAVWGVWDGGARTVSRLLGPLTAEQRSWPVLDTPSLDELVDYIEREQRPEDEDI